MKYCLPEIPKTFWINSITYKCKLCGHNFDLLLPNGNDIVKYQEVNGIEVRWLPTYGKGGYLELMSKLVTNYNPNDEITMKIAREFDKTLQRFVEPSKNGNSFTLADYKPLCPQCNSKELQFIKEVTLTSPNVTWVKVPCDLI